MYKVTVITVVYNAESSIEKSILSVRHQLQRGVQHLVIDGMSTDKTLDIIKQHSHQDMIVISEKDNGIYDAMNKGLALAKGEVVGFLNADDFYANDHVLKEVVANFGNPDVDVCYANLDYVDAGHGEKVVRRWRSNPFTVGLFARGWSPAHPTFFVRRSILSRLGFYDLSISIGNDVEWMMRALEVLKLKSVFTPRVWVKMSTGGQSNQSVKNIILQNIEIWRALKKFNLQTTLISFLFFKLLSRIRQRFV